jgi:RNA polymerase sigma-70 factor (ECF subfamily)
MENSNDKNDRTNEQLMGNYLDGDESALPVLIKNNLNLVFNFVRRMVRTEHDAEDVTQESFVKVWKKSGTYRRGARFSPWLLSIARNTALDFLKKKKEFVFSQFESDDDGNFLEAGLADPEPLPDEIFSRAGLVEQVQAALAQIATEQREVIVLRHESNMTFEEIGDIVSRPLNTVKSQYRRGLQVLREILVDGYSDLTKNG